MISKRTVGYVETEIQAMEWIDDEMIEGFVMIDGRRWKAVVTKNEYCPKCDGFGCEECVTGVIEE